jgi:Fe-S-cluster containining protein
MHLVDADIEKLSGGLYDPVQLENGKWQCGQWDPDTRLCLIYENRPSVCKEWFPIDYDGACPFCGGKGVPVE